MLPHCKKLYLVDPFYRLAPFWKTSSGPLSSREALTEILNVYSSEIDSGRVEVIVDFAETWLRAAPSSSLDFVYLDASHQFLPTLAEIRAALVAVKKGGWITGDDYDPDPNSNQHGVYLAVNAVLDELGKKLEINESRQWAFQV